MPQLPRLRRCEWVCLCACLDSSLLPCPVLSCPVLSGVVLCCVYTHIHIQSSPESPRSRNLCCCFFPFLPFFCSVLFLQFCENHPPPPSPIGKCMWRDQTAPFSEVPPYYRPPDDVMWWMSKPTSTEWMQEGRNGDAGTPLPPPAFFF